MPENFLTHSEGEPAHAWMLERGGPEAGERQTVVRQATLSHVNVGRVVCDLQRHLGPLASVVDQKIESNWLQRLYILPPLLIGKLKT